MSDLQYVFVMSADTRPELLLFAASIGRSLSRGHVVRFVDEEPEELFVRDQTLARLRIHHAEIDSNRSRLIMCGDADLLSGRAIGNVWQLSLATDPSPSVRLETEGSRYSFPLVMSSAVLRRFGRTLPERPRVLVALDGTDDRRERMVARVCEELAARRWPHTLVTLAPSARVARRVAPAEGWINPGAFELGSLVASATIMLDPVEGDDGPSALSCLAASVGVPVVSHATGLLARRAYGDVRYVAEWSPDAFTDAVIEAAVDVPDDLRWGTEFEEVADDFGRVIQSA